jgi:hypothetical protein
MAKQFPSYVPAPILQDYNEACQIVDLSPKAAATLSRRCLQGMIRDFHGIVKYKLADEIKALEAKVGPELWNAIDAVRSIGNIGAHMEKDISVITDVDPGEAKLLIELVEDLITDWYVHREDQRSRVAKLTAAAKAKKPGAAVLANPDVNVPQEPAAVVLPPAVGSPTE